jgi:prevent-host-death family protein
MQTAAVSELKASASAFLKRVKAGEEILVTDRGTPIAKIIPLRPGNSPSDNSISNLELKGLARVGKGCLPDDFWNAPRPRDERCAALGALLAEREEGR